MHIQFIQYVSKAKQMSKQNFRRTILIGALLTTLLGSIACINQKDKMTENYLHEYDLALIYANFIRGRVHGIYI